ncbi:MULTISPECIES: phosphatase PAP2 family protein [Polymorphospora]|uniref:Phosphatase PAP2 family protein n=1 Tax=Polymorphospora lycopeni TaxID=3140240 RepID=A0ABV5CTM2_9ACTN
MQLTRTVRQIAGLTPRPVRPAGWWLDGVLLVATAALTLALANGLFLDTDIAVRDWVDSHRPEAAYWTARVFNFLGQGGWLLMPVAGLLAAALAWRSRSVRPALVFAGGFLITYATIGPMKLLLHRGYPHNEDVAHPERLFSDPTEHAYPSGHVANAIVWYGVITLLLAGLLRHLHRPDVSPAVYRTIRVAPPAIVFCTTTYLGFHWITDSIAGFLLGLLLSRLLSRVPWDDLPLPALPNGFDRPAIFNQPAAPVEKPTPVS